MPRPGAYAVITGLAYAPYTRALASPYRYGHIEMHERKGFVLRGKVNGHTYYSEASPLAGHSKENLVDVAHALATIEDGKPALPCVRFGLAALRAQGRPFRGPIQSNALLPWRGPQETRQLAQEFLATGYRILKLKVLENHLDEQIAFLHSLPEITFRLDANGALSVPGMKRLFSRLSGLRIDYVEEPHRGNWNLAELAFAPVHLAADESMEQLDLLQAKFPPQVLIAKPMISGGAMPPGRRLVYTTSLEAEPGRRALLAWLGQDGTTEVSGLSTGFLFRENFLPDQPIWNELPPISEPEQAWLGSLNWSEVRA